MEREIVVESDIVGWDAERGVFSSNVGLAIGFGKVALVGTIGFAVRGSHDEARVVS
jgi:hypothetical protein